MPFKQAMVSAGHWKRVVRVSSHKGRPLVSKALTNTNPSSSVRVRFLSPRGGIILSATVLLALVARPAWAQSLQLQPIHDLVESVYALLLGLAVTFGSGVSAWYGYKIWTGFYERTDVIKLVAGMVFIFASGAIMMYGQQALS